MYNSRTKPEVLAISCLLLIIAALWGAWFAQAPGLLPFWASSEADPENWSRPFRAKPERGSHVTVIANRTSFYTNNTNKWVESEIQAFGLGVQGVLPPAASIQGVSPGSDIGADNGVRSWARN